MQLHCPTCSSSIDSNDINLDRMVAKCRSCHRGKNGTTFTYDLKAALKNGKSTVLVKKIPEAEQALYIEQAVEDALGIIDIAMPGEIAKLRA